MKVDQARKFKDLELENTRLKKLVADLSLLPAGVAWWL
jgi:putative transposase